VSCRKCRCSACCPAPAGLTRLVDKRKVRRDLADVFCTTAEGVRADRAKQWRWSTHGEAAAVRRDGEGAARELARSPTGPAARAWR
jgi:benzoyl-CoA-dihydrodiol lyase